MHDKDIEHLRAELELAVQEVAARDSDVHLLRREVERLQAERLRSRVRPSRPSAVPSGGLDSGWECEEDAVFSEFEAIMYRARKRVLCAPSAHRVAIYGVFLSDWDATVRRMRKNLVDMDSIRLHLERAEGGNG